MENVFLNFSWFNRAIVGRHARDLDFRILTVNNIGWLSEPSVHVIPEWW